MKLKQISWIPAFCIMVIIFCFSSKPAVNSNENSMTIAKSIYTIYENIANKPIDTDHSIIVIEKINHVVRKGSHFCEYALLAVTFALHLFILQKKGWKLYLLPVFLSAFYASTDELHQTFVAGRSGQVSDVLLDTSGAAAGILFFSILLAIIVRYKTHYYKKRKTT